ncbi:bacteriophage abortive infection AbiH family protein [Poseidonibacter lekithochrous]|uniref:AbiH family protein n=1 Tax=Poseidonibacter TaxID=2321187 RepID=UPI001C099171|nr:MULTISPECIES: AbiH family protein [Poseidonibacter]MBU3013426.1 bacteriophage abortive infection AbiH family protein [Poseidonibacter lekithochrous]MDO6826723.1 AbiH family protein [Poseidonibacter sp. 1_MG-2023]
MKILIIGNGFDLNLGLKTSYKDFIQSEHFKDLVAKRNNMAEYFNEKNELNNWVDIENELNNYSIKVKNKNLDIEDNFNEIRLSLMNYLKEAQEKDINQDSKAFEILKEEIDKVDTIFNFNYTNSVFKVAEILNIQNIENKHYYVHGSIEDKDIIFGVEDKARLGDEEHIFLKKAYNKNYGKHNIKKEFNKKNEIIIFGHSIGITDSSYFEDYINQRSNDIIQSKFKFYYYGKSGWKEMMKIVDKYTFRSLTEFRANNFIHIDSSI